MDTPAAARLWAGGLAGAGFAGAAAGVCAAAVLAAAVAEGALAGWGRMKSAGAWGIVAAS